MVALSNSAKQVATILSGTASVVFGATIPVPMEMYSGLTTSFYKSCLSRDSRHEVLSIDGTSVRFTMPQAYSNEDQEPLVPMKTISRKIKLRIGKVTPMVFDSVEDQNGFIS